MNKRKLLSILVSMLLVLQLLVPVGSAWAAAESTILPPSDVTTQVVNVDDVKLSWGPVYEATGYYVYEITDGQLIRLGKATSTTYTVMNASIGSHSYVITTISALGESGPCAPLQVEIVLPTMEPPASVTYTIQNFNDIVLNWTSAPNAESYKIYEIASDGQPVLLGTKSDRTFTITKTTSSIHTYAVSTVHSQYGESPISSPVNVNVVWPTILPPATVTSTLTNLSDIVLSWDAAAQATGYKVYQIINGKRTLKSTVSQTTVTYVNVPAGDYIYEVTTYSDRFGESLSGTQTALTVGPVTMAPPTGLTYKIQNGNDIVLNWGTAANATAYNVYQIASDGQKTLKSTTRSRTVTYTNMAPGIYTFSVHTTSDRYGESAEGSTITVTVNPVNLLPPANAAATIQNISDVTLTWNIAAYANAYRIYRVVDGVKTLTASVSEPTIVWTTMAGGNYEYVIHTYSDRFGESAEGSVVTFNVETVTLSAPANLTSKIVNGNDIVLSWSPVANATNYKVYQLVAGKKVLKNTTSNTTVTYTNLTAGDYTYIVHAYSTRFGESPEGSTQVINLMLPIMLPPGGLTQSVTSVTDFTLNWEPSAYATGYNVYQVINGQKVLKSTSTSTNAIFTGMTPGEYSYIVHSLSSRFGESAEGAPLTFTLNGETMQPPGSPTYTITNINDIVLKWTAAPNATKYKIYQLVDGQKVLKTTTSNLMTTYTSMPAGEYTFYIHSVSTILGESPVGAELKLSLVYPQFGTPANLKYTVQNGNDLVLSWDSVPYANSYNVYRVIEGQKVLQANISTTSQTFVNVPTGDYAYEIYAVNTKMGEALEGAKLSFHFDLPVMQPPAALTSSVVKVNDIVLQWSAVSLAASYKIYQVVDGQRVLKKTLAATNTTFTTMPAGDYTYEVHSYNSRFGESPVGAAVSVKLEYESMLPPVNASIQAVNGNDLSLTWDIAANASSYKVYEVVNGVKTLKTTVTAAAATFTTLPAGNYTYIIHSFSDRFGESAEGKLVSISLVYPTIEPPVNLSYTIANGSDLTLKWDAASYATAYKVYQIVNGSRVFKRTTLTTTAAFAGLTAGTYVYEVRTYSDRFGESAQGTQVTITVEYQMEAPTGLLATVTNGNDIGLSWNAVTYAGSYNVYQVIDGLKVLKGNVTTPSITFTNMPAGNYTYEVHSNNDKFGESALGAQTVVDLVLPAMLAPATLSRTVSNYTDVSLRWSAVEYATAYKIYEVINGEKVYKRKVAGTSALFTYLTGGDHTFMVHSFNDRYGESAEGTSLTFTLTPPVMLAPETASYTVENGTDLTLNWGAAANAVSYKVYQVVNGQKVLKSTVDNLTSVTYPMMPEGEYRFVIHSYNERFGESAEGRELAFTLDYADMQTPGTLTKTITNGNDIVLKWGSAPNATAYNVYQIVDGKRVLKRKLPGLTTTFTNMPAGEYRYEVTSYSDRFGESPVPAALTFTLEWPVLQASPLNGVVVNANNITFTWTAAAWANEYRLYEVTGGVRKLVYQGTALTAQAYNLTEGMHSFELAVYNTRFGESAANAVSKFQQEIVFPVMQSPAVALKLGTDNSAKLTWNFITFANGYNVYEIVDGKRVLLTKSLNALTYTVTNLTDGIHEYVVTSLSNSFGESEPSNVVVARLISDATPPVTIAIYPTDWIGEDAVVTFQATDTESGVANTYYAVDSLPLTAGTTAVISEEGIHTVSYYSVDKAGNQEVTQTLEVKIDKTAPVTAANAPRGWVRIADVKLAATDPQSGVAQTYYSINGSEYVEGTTLQVDQPGIHQVNFYSVDKVGNKETPKTIEVKIDRTAPVTTTAAPVGWSKEAFKLDLLASDTESGVEKTFYSLNGSEYEEGAQVSVSSNGLNRISYYSVDAAGNVEEPVSVEVMVDTVPPVTESDAPAGWSKDAVQVTLTATDVGSGVAKTYYSVNGSEYVEGTSFTVDQSGITPVTFYSVDVAGNVETVKSIEIKIDRTPPVTTSDAPVGWITEAATITLTATDTQSGVDKTFYSINGSDFTEGTSVKVTKNGINTITFYSVDAAGNVEEVQSTEVWVDLVPPVTAADAPANWVKETVEVKLTATDVGSGVAKTFYSINGLEFVEGISFTVDQAGITPVTFYSIDVAGNVEAVKTIEIKIDRTPPVTTSDAPVGWVNKAVKITLTATDAESGVAQTFYSINGSDFTEGTSFNVTKNGINTITFYSVDVAGNVEEVQSAEVWLDLVPPVTVSDAPANWVKDAVKVTLTATDVGSGVATTFYSINGSEYVEGTVFTVDQAGITPVTFYSVDVAGNVEEVKKVEIKIDRTPPVTTSDAPEYWNKDAVKVTLAATDAESGVAKTFYSLDGSNFTEGTAITVTKAGINLIYFYSVDVAGNVEEVKTAEVKIDQTAPVITLDLKQEYALGTQLALNYLAKDEYSGIVSESMIVLAPGDTAGRTLANGSVINLSQPGVYTVTVTATNGAGLSTTVKKQFVVYVPATIEVTPIVIKGNSGVFTVRVDLPANYKGASIDLNTAQLNGVKALTSNNGYYNQAKNGQFKFERSDFSWTGSEVLVEFRGVADGILFVGYKVVKIQK